jgi:hypothetical protein
MVQAAPTSMDPMASDRGPTRTVRPQSGAAGSGAACRSGDAAASPTLVRAGRADGVRGDYPREEVVTGRVRVRGCSRKRQRSSCYQPANRTSRSRRNTDRRTAGQRTASAGRCGSARRWSRRPNRWAGSSCTNTRWHNLEPESFSRSSGTNPILMDSTERLLVTRNSSSGLW